MKDIFYSIIVVCLNSGERLALTVDSILRQYYENFEVIIKDGGSTDGSLENLKNKYSDSRIKIFEKKDSGIYDAMNQAVTYAGGDYFLFLNTGDKLYNDSVLFDMAHEIIENKRPGIIYGNQYHKALDTVIYAAPNINDFACYRNVPCHQTCFYSRDMFSDRAYMPKYTVRADYEHFLYCYYEKKAVIKYAPVIVAEYEGEGFSETKENKLRSKKQHREIVVRYMGRRKADKYRLIMIITLAPLRTWVAENKYLSSAYNALKTIVYKVYKVHKLKG
jgi:glycosyltransferase involved in cell wall biosynthesis